MNRTAEITRTTKETDISLALVLPPHDNEAESSIATSVPFMDHMLELFAFHSGCHISLTAKGDTDIDFHHTVEDTGICLGQAINTALGDKRGINRYGFFVLPMDEARAEVSLDISGRPYFVWQGIPAEGTTGQFGGELINEFFQALTVHAGITLHINVPAGNNLHHIIEAVFKGFARAFRTAVSYDGSQSLPSTKGLI